MERPLSTYLACTLHHGRDIDTLEVASPDGKGTAKICTYCFDWIELLHKATMTSRFDAMPIPGGTEISNESISTELPDCQGLQIVPAGSRDAVLRSHPSKENSRFFVLGDPTLHLLI